MTENEQLPKQEPLPSVQGEPRVKMMDEDGTLHPVDPGATPLTVAHEPLPPPEPRQREEDEEERDDHASAVHRRHKGSAKR